MSKNLLKLTDAPHTALKHTPLVLSLCQIKFTNLFGITDQSLIAFQRALQKKYPVVGSAEAEITIAVDSLSTGTREELRKVPQWLFTDTDDNWRIGLSQEVLTLGARAYNHFDEFLERLDETIGFFIEHIQPTFIGRIGLQHINEIRARTLKANTPWSRIICHHLLGPLAIPEFTEQARGMASTQRLVLHYADDVELTLRHGLYGKGSTVKRYGENPDIHSDPFYLLDFDIFREFLLPGTIVKVNSSVIHRFVE